MSRFPEIKSQRELDNEMASAEAVNPLAWWLMAAMVSVMIGTAVGLGMVFVAVQVMRWLGVL
jgi:hypothetical protein